MAAYYHTHGTTDIPDHGLHHTLMLMNPNFAGAGGYTDPQPPPSNNILLLNSAAAAAAATAGALPHHHQFAGRGHQLPPQQENITLYGYPQSEPARELTRAGSRQGLSLSLSSSQNPAPYGHAVPPSEARDVSNGRGPGSVLGSKYLKVAQELLEEVVHVGDGLLRKTTTDSPKKTPPSGSTGKGAGDSPEENHSGNSGGDGGGTAQLTSAERQELQMKKAKLVTMLDEAEQRYRQYHQQMQIVIASFEQAAGSGSAKTYTALALKTISKQFRCLKDAIQAQIRAASKSLGEEAEGGGGLSGGNKLEGSSRLKYIDHQIRQQRALQQLGMIQNHSAWRPQRGLPERSVSVLRAWLFEHFLHPYPKDSDKIILAKQTGLTRSQVSNWFINARVRLWKPMVEEMYTEEIKEQELQNNGSQEKTTISSKENSNVSNSGIDQEKLNIYDQIQATTTSDNKGNLKDQNVTVSSYNTNTNTNNTMLEMEGIPQGSPKRPRNAEVLHNCDGNSREIFIKFGSDKQGRENHNNHNNNNTSNNSNNGYPMISGGMNFVGGGNELSSYPTTIGEMGRFGTEEFPAPRFLPGNGISLSLGLPPSETHHQQQLNLSATNHTFLSPNPTIQFRRADHHDFGSINSPSSHSSAAGFECIDIQNRKGFAAQLLHDFVVN